MDTAEVDAIVAEYEAGRSVEGIAAARQLGYGTVRTALIGAGVTLRRPGRPRSGSPGRARVSTVLPGYGTTPRGAA